MVMDRVPIQPVPLELLVAEARETPEAASQACAAQVLNNSCNGQFRSRLLVERWLADCGVGFRVKADADNIGRTVFVLRQCPFDTSHGDPDSCIMQDADGKMSAHCFHNSCQGRGWQDFKEAIGKPEAHHYDPPLERTRYGRRTGGQRDVGENASDSIASAEIPLPEGDTLKLRVSSTGRDPLRLVIANRGEIEHRDQFNIDSSTSRERFIKKLAGKLGIEAQILVPLVESQLTKLEDEIATKGPAKSPRSADDEQSQATIAVNMAADWELWHSDAPEAYATIPVGDHLETWPVKSQIFKRYVGKEFFNLTRKAMNTESVSAAINLLEAKALYEGEQSPIHMRVAECEGAIYLDLCNSTWQAVEITSQGWRVVNNPPVRFRRSKGMLALPMPERGGSIELLRSYLNCSDTDWRLIVSWLISTFRPQGPYPILGLFSEQGTGKSTVGRLLRSLIDPNKSPLRAEPNDCRDLMIAANNSWCLAFDNLSYIPPWLSDAFCRLSTGGGFSTRELYTDQDEIIFDSQRPVLLTSIEEVATQSDLLDRSLVGWLTEISDNRRRSEEELFQEFEKVRPLILGALLDAVVVALQRLPSLKLANLPRMADFAIWASAAETAFGWPEGSFMQAYKGNRESANEVALEASIVASPLLDLLEETGSWSGRAVDLLTALENRVSDQIKRQKSWPKNGGSLSRHLTRLSPNLKKAGWLLDRDRSSRERTWTIQRRSNGADDASSSSEASCPSPSNSMQTDAARCETTCRDANDTNDAISGQPWNPDRY